LDHTIGVTQHVLPSIEVQSKFIFEHSQLTDPIQDEKNLQSLIKQLASIPFDLSNDLPIRSYLFSFSSSPSIHILVLLQHHIAIDHGGDFNLLEELKTLYCGEVLPPLPIQYLDYDVHEQQAQSSQHFLDGLEYWLKKLVNVSLIFHLINLDPLIELESDIMIGTVVGNRTQSEIQNLCGFFVNTCILQTKVTSDSSYTDLLKQAKQNLTEMLLYQDIPFNILVEKLVTKHDPSIQPFFYEYPTINNTKH